jgi:FKBP-type peptidyl-prolyl cis-trans isomerase SlyD
MTDKNTVSYNYVINIDYTLKINGKVIDSSIGFEPLIYLHGHNNIIPGLERELLGMEVGESKNIIVLPQEAYGEFDPAAFSNVPLSKFDERDNIAIGSTIEMEDEDGVVMIAEVISIEDAMVKLDFNHPLAGKELHFDVTILALRAATDDEIKHGNVQVPK